MINPNAIIRTNRRSLSLTISKDGRLIVRAPKKLSMEYIYSFIKQKERWILNKQKQIESSHIVNHNLINYDEFLLFGKSYSKIEVNKLKDFEVSDDSIFIPSNLESEKFIVMALKWYNKVTKEIINKRIEYFSDLMQVDYNSIKTDNSKSRWGSCDAKGNVKFNLRICMLPHKVIDYVIIHELSHLIEFNHSKKFYKLIESVMPDYKNYRLVLKEHNFLLQLLR